MLLAVPGNASAGAYPSNKCVADKVKAARSKCKKVLQAWSTWEKNQDDGERDGRLLTVANKFDTAWTSAEEKAARKGVDCADTTLSSLEMESLIDAAIAGIVTEINTGLDLSGNHKHANCGSKLLKVAAIKCGKLLKAESKHLKKLDHDPDGAALAGEQAKASEKFSHGWAQATRKDCPTTATKEGIEGLIDALSADVVFNSTVSPNVPNDAFMAITHPPGGDPNNPVTYDKEALVPQCQDGSAYTFFAKRGSENKLLMYYYGGGACWDAFTCGAALCTQTADPTPPALSGSGFGDFTNPDNPFKDWHVVLIPYCSCDVHWGSNQVDYGVKVVEHRGHDNAKLAEKWAREHFVKPTDIFITGSSAGSYGASMHGIHLNEVYPASNINVMGDGGNGVITQEFLELNFPNWGVVLPDVPGIIDVPIEDLSMPDVSIAAAKAYPRTNWSHYTTAFDGGSGGQTGFYNVMLNDNNPLAGLVWWEASCAFNAEMHQRALDTVAAAELENGNYRYYIASGSRHTGFGNPRVYADTTGGVPPLVDWMNAMIADDPAWVNVEASPFNVLFPGDPEPSPLQAPFGLSDPNDPGSPVIVNCP
jgi:hypothetical protein